MANDLKWLLFSDIHFPHHDKRAVDMLFKVIKRWKPDVIDGVGDIDDQSCFSRFNEDQPEEVLGEYNKYAHIVKEFWSDVRDLRPDAEIVFHTGNHDIRYESYLRRKAAAFAEYITPEAMWGVETQGIEVHHYNRPPVKRYGDLFVHHGPYALKDSGSSVKKCLDEFNVSCLVGHSHRQGAVFQSYPLAERELRGWEIGHLCDITSPAMEYDYKHNWQQGFATGIIENGNYPHINLVGISPDYTAYVDGKRIVG